MQRTCGKPAAPCPKVAYTRHRRGQLTTLLPENGCSTATLGTAVVLLVVTYLLHLCTSIFTPLACDGDDDTPFEGSCNADNLRCSFGCLRWQPSSTPSRGVLYLYSYPMLAYLASCCTQTDCSSTSPHSICPRKRTVDTVHAPPPPCIHPSPSSSHGRLSSLPIAGAGTHTPKDLGCRVSYHVSHIDPGPPHNRILSHIPATLSPHTHHPLSPICPPHSNLFRLLPSPLPVPCCPSHSVNCTIPLGSYACCCRPANPLHALLPTHVYTLTSSSPHDLSCWLRLIFTQYLISSHTICCASCTTSDTPTTYSQFTSLHPYTCRLSIGSPFLLQLRCRPVFVRTLLGAA